MTKHVHIHLHGTQDSWEESKHKRGTGGKFATSAGNAEHHKASQRAHLIESPAQKHKFAKGELVKGRWTAPITYIEPVSESYAAKNNLIDPHSWVRNPYGTKQAEPDSSLKKHNPDTA